MKTAFFFVASLLSVHAYSAPAPAPEAAAYESVCADMLARGAKGAAPVCARCLELKPESAACGAERQAAASAKAPAPAAPSAAKLAQRCGKAIRALDYPQADEDCRACLQADASQDSCKTVLASIGSRAERKRCSSAMEGADYDKAAAHCKRCLEIDGTDVACMLTLKMLPGLRQGAVK